MFVVEISLGENIVSRWIFMWIQMLIFCDVAKLSIVGSVEMSHENAGNFSGKTNAIWALTM